MKLLRYSCILVLAAACWAQHPDLEPNTPGQKPVPTVAFDFVLQGANPVHYAIKVESSGRAAYRADNPNTEDKTGEPYLLKFTIPDTLARRIFDLTRQASYFRGNFDYKKRRIAYMGTKTLSYAEGPADSFGQPTNGYRYQTSYNWSQNAAIQQLTDIFQDISSTIEHGRKLQFQHRFDKLGLADELKNMEDARRGGHLPVLQAIAPVLQEIATDPAVMDIARKRARELLNSAQIPAQPSSD